MDKGYRVISKRPFHELFQSAFSSLNGLVWLFGEDSFLGLPDEEWKKIEQCSLTAEDKGKFGSTYHYGKWAKMDLFPIYAEYVNEDWNDFFGSSNIDIDWHAWYREYSNTENLSDRAKLVQKCCDFCFYSIDGAFWEFYCNDQDILVDLGKHLNSLSDVRTEEVKMFECHGL